jgi:hypothetical protein
MQLSTGGNKMKNRLPLMTAVAVAFLLVGFVPVHGQNCPCTLICPAGDGGPTGPPSGGYKTPDLDGDGDVDLVDFSIFAGCWPTYCFCVDYDCNGVINLVDFSYFAFHWGHRGPIRGFNQPDIDHYKTYDVAGPEHLGPILLRDQFQDEFVDMILMTKFATPVKKNNFPYCDSIVHYTWWDLIDPVDPEPLLFVNAQDQFGFHDLEVRDSRFLLTPALKYPEAGDTIPEKNHYLCYDAVGEPLDIDVHLVDQFDSTFVVILQPEYFCNPCVKELLDSGIIYPIVDPLAHLIVYRIDNPHQYDIFATMLDQFGFWQMNLWDNFYLVVPALKNSVQIPGD